MVPQSEGKGCAYLMPIPDPALQAYLQRHPFCAGPDQDLNQRCRVAVQRWFGVRPCGTEVAVTQLETGQTVLPAEALARLDRMFDQLGVSRGDRTSQIDDFGWEANLVPGSARRVLVVGCGDGVELLFLRAALPEAEITAMDYHNSIAPKLAEIVRLTFIEGDLNERLSELAQSSFDLIFSNHTMEHFYTPDETLRRLSQLLVTGGTIISTLPMDAAPGSPFLDRVHAQADRGSLHPIDIVYLDPGHPWKTTAEDLCGTLSRAGFSSMEIFQRRDHLSRPFAGSPEEFRRQRDARLRLYGWTFAPVRAVLRALFPGSVPFPILRLLFAAERRSGVGSNTIKNEFTEEALFRAVRKRELPGPGRRGSNGRVSYSRKAVIFFCLAQWHLLM